jgi:hypothetical protein
MNRRAGFEHRLIEGLNEIAGPARVLDASAIAARAAVAAARPTGRLVRWPIPMAPADRRWMLLMRLGIAAAALLVAAAIAVVAGMLLRVPDDLQACAGVAKTTSVVARPSEGAAWTVGPSGVSGGDPAARTIVAIESSGANAGSVVLIDTIAGIACRLITAQDVEFTDGDASWGLPVRVLPSPTGTAIAISLRGRVLVWSDMGLVQVWPTDFGSDPQSASVQGMVWAPDASVLGVWGWNDDGGLLELMSVDGSPHDPLVLGGQITGAAWSPDGSRLAVSHRTAPAASFDTVITVANMTSGGTTDLTDGSDSPQIVRTWREDDVLVVTRFSPTLPDRAQLVSVDDLGNLVDGAPPMPGSAIPHRSWVSPDGAWNAVATEWADAHDLLVVDVRTALQRTDVATGVGTNSDYDIVSWAPDSRSLAFTTSDSAAGAPTGVWIVNVDGTGLRRVAGSGLSLVNYAWLPGGGSR